MKLEKWQENFVFGDYSKADKKTQSSAGWSSYWVPIKYVCSKTKRYGKILAALNNKDWNVMFKNKMDRNGKTYDEIYLGVRMRILVRPTWRKEKYIVFKDDKEILSTNYVKKLINCLNKEE